MTAICDPHAREEVDSQGMLAMLYDMVGDARSRDLPVSREFRQNPAAGAQGELAAFLAAAGYFCDKGEDHEIAIFPSSACGTNLKCCRLINCVTPAPKMVLSTLRNWRNISTRTPLSHDSRILTTSAN
ncbi:MAG: hypothetical protein R3C01_13180 [Planctomycetaceae bacterium]